MQTIPPKEFLPTRSRLFAVENVMSIKDIFFPMISYPVPTLPVAVEKVIGLAVGLRAQISGSTFEINIRSPVGFYADFPEIISMVDAETKKSVVNARDLVALFTNVATHQNAITEHSVEQCMSAELPSLLVDHARFRDLTIFPLKEADQHGRGLVEALIFESGRPVLLLPATTKRTYIPAPHRLHSYDPLSSKRDHR